jgi:MFS family permease
MVWTIAGGIAAGILGGIVLGIASPRQAGQRDERDREIGRFGERVGGGFVVIGGVVALVLALLSAEHFWIANVLYLCFVLSAVVQVIAKVVAYRRGLREW